MATFPLTFPAPSAATVALPTKREFTHAWRKEAEVAVGDLRVVPSLSLCQLYFDFIRGHIPMKPFVVTSTEEARKSCALNSRDEKDPGSIPRRLHEAGLR